MANVIIDLAAEFTGKKAFKQAETSTEKLTKGVKRLAAAFGVAFGVRGAALAVKAFAEDDKAAQALGKTLQNLGLAYGSSAATVNGYISRLEQQTGVLDDELRPAMDRFLRATLSVTKSQDLLNLALDISAGTGKSLTQVSQSLQKAYLGQTQALGRLGVGLSKAELESANFEEIQSRLSVLFAGQASTAANTYAGEIAKLQVAVNNAKETIGKGFVDALKTASGSSTIDPVVQGINKVANAFAYVTREAGKVIAITKDIFKNPSFFAPTGGLFGDGKGFGNIQLTGGSNQDTQRADLAAKKKAEAAAAAAAAALLKSQKALLKSQQDQLKLAKARATFDLQKIQIEAALKGKLSEEDRIRLKLMKAIENENLTDVEKYQKALEAAQTKTKELSALLETVKTLEIKDPFGMWKVDPVTEAINQLTKSIGGVGTQITASGKEWSSFANLVATTILKPNLSEWSSSFGKITADTGTVLGNKTDGTLGNKTTDPLIIKAEADAAKAKAESEANAAKIKALEAEAAASKAIAEGNAYAVRNAAAAAAAAQAALEAKIAALEAANKAAADAAANANANGSKIEVTVQAPPFTDPNAIAEAVDNVLRNARERGTLVAI